MLTQRETTRSMDEMRVIARQSPVTHPASQTPTCPKPRRFLRVTGAVFLLASCIGGVYYYRYHTYLASLQKTDTDVIVKEVGIIIDLPNDEAPSIATVTDRDKLSSQSFFKNARNDDKVLIYTKAGKAILYRPSTRKIIDVSTVVITDTHGASAKE